MIARFRPQDFYMKIYLVNLVEKKFLMVKRKLLKFLKLDYDECTWIEKRSLGDFALFLGDNTSIVVSASNILRCQQDYIYFNHDFERMTYITFGNRGPPDFDEVRSQVDPWRNGSASDSRSEGCVVLSVVGYSEVEDQILTSPVSYVLPCMTVKSYLMQARRNKFESIKAEVFGSRDLDLDRRL
ncbi:hypothetical protein GBA52_006043 [Prunus armeniaca]|nr:hypothetical protein GBA52_006043 [Prunus armeniaca]